jgi:hypothetical protein
MYVLPTGPGHLGNPTSHSSWSFLSSVAHAMRRVLSLGARAQTFEPGGRHTGIFGFTKYGCVYVICCQDGFTVPLKEPDTRQFIIFKYASWAHDSMTGGRGRAKSTSATPATRDLGRLGSSRPSGWCVGSRAKPHSGWSCREGASRLVAGRDGKRSGDACIDMNNKGQ